MRVAEILRSLADLIAAAENNEPLQTGMPGEEADCGSSEQELDPNPVMVPPLQQRIELDKRAVDVDNHFTDKENEENGEGAELNDNDELEQMKKIAGLLGSKNF